MSPNLLEEISKRTISEGDLKSAIDHLGQVIEPVSFWLHILNDETYPPAHRAQALCQLFKRQVRTPIKVADLATLLEWPDWINADTLSVVKHLKGEMPVEWNLGETVLALRMTPVKAEIGPVLYLRLSKSVTVETFVHAMKASQPGPTELDASLLEAACSSARE